MGRLHVDNGEPCIAQKVCIATTVYGKTSDSYTFALHNTFEALHKAGMQTAYYLLQGNPHGDDARNRIIQEFLTSDCTELFFIDADVSWQADDLVKLCGYDKGIVGAVYPYRREDKADELPMNMKATEVRDDNLLEVDGLPTGFLRIKRHVIEQMVEACDEFDGDNGHESKTPILFQRTLIEGVRWGADLDFCNRWRGMGGHVWCDPEIILGHEGTVVFSDSVGAFMRRRGSLTLKYVADKIRSGTWTNADIEEAKRYDDNKWGAPAETIAIAIRLAEKADKPILEAGSGLTTVLMAAATDQTVFCLEHNEYYAMRLKRMVSEANVDNIGLCLCPLKDEWYDISNKTLPDKFFFGFVDGPPRDLSNRRKFMDVFGDRVDAIICDDVDEDDYRAYLITWSLEKKRISTFMQPRTMIIK